MKSIFDNPVNEEIIVRINTLDKNSKALWGTMTVEQMIRHCVICEEYYQGKFVVERSPLGIKIGAKAITEILKNEQSNFGKNADTNEVFKVTTTDLNLEEEKNKWILLIKHYEMIDLDTFTHWFFGEMSKEQLGQFIYKHSDHHLKQFGV